MTIRQFAIPTLRAGALAPGACEGLPTGGGAGSVLGIALKADGRTAAPDPEPGTGYDHRPDHFAFARLGVPMLYLDGGAFRAIGDQSCKASEKGS